jgi:hypothetical protein
MRSFTNCTRLETVIESWIMRWVEHLARGKGYEKYVQGLVEKSKANRHVACLDRDGIIVVNWGLQK